MLARYGAWMNGDGAKWSIGGTPRTGISGMCQITDLTSMDVVLMAKQAPTTITRVTALRCSLT